MPTAAVRADELGVRHAADQPERLEHACVQLQQRDPIRIGCRQRPRHEDASLVGDDEGRCLVAARAREPYFQTKDGGVDVIDVTRDELLEEVIGAAVAEVLERAPEFRRGLKAPDAERCCLGTRLEDSTCRSDGEMCDPQSDDTIGHA